MKKMILVIFAVLLGSLVLAACAPSAPQPQPTPAPTATAKPTQTAAPTGTASPTQAPSTPTPTAAANVKPIVLRHAAFTPPTSVMEQGWIWYFNEVEKRTSGRIKFEHYWGGSLIKSTEMLKAGAAGMADMVAIVPSYYVAELPYWQFGGSVPFTFQSIEQQLAGFRKMYSKFPVLQEELSKFNQRVAMFHSFDFQQLYSKVPINSLADLKGLKVRVASAGAGKAMSAVGAVPVFGTSAETYEILQKNVALATSITQDAAIKFSLQELVKYGVNINLLVGSAYFHTIRNDVWDKIPKELQDIMTQVSQEKDKVFIDSLVKAQKADSATLEAAGVKFVDFSAELKKWMDSPDIKAMPTAWADNATKQGLTQAKAVLQEYLGILGVSN